MPKFFTNNFGVQNMWCKKKRNIGVKNDVKKQIFGVKNLV